MSSLRFRCKFACRTAGVAFFSLTALHATANADEFDVTQWELVTAVSATFPGGDAEYSQTVTNPFQVTHTAQFLSSTATTTYSFAWNDTFGDFLVEVTHRAADVDPLRLTSGSSGFIYLTAMTDLLFIADAEYSYSLPVDPMYTAFAFTVYDAQPPNLAVFNGGGHYDTSVYGAPASGTFPANGQAILSAGHTWVIAYQMEVNAYYGYSGQIAQGDGYLHFTLSEVPEPAALFPLALGALLLCQRRTR
jgi:hypothetical protein